MGTSTGKLVAGGGVLVLSFQVRCIYDHIQKKCAYFLLISGSRVLEILEDYLPVEGTISIIWGERWLNCQF